MSAHVNGLARLEVDASDAINQVTNHSGDGGTTGWVSTGGSGALVVSTQFEGGNSLRVGDDRSPTTTQRKTGISSTSIPTAPGIWVNFETQTVGTLYDVAVRDGFSMSVTFLDSASNVIGTVKRTQRMAYPPSGSWATQKFGAPVQAPAGAAFYRVAIGLETPTPWTSSYNMLLFARRWMVVSSPTQILVLDVPFTTEPVWQNMLGKSYSIKTASGMDVDGVTDRPFTGSLSAVLSDPLFDPVNNPRMRPGRKIRLMAVDQLSGQPFELWSGRIATLDNSYAGGRLRTSITATDAIAELANVPVPRGVSGTFGVRVQAIMNQTAVPYVVVDPSAALPSAVIDNQDNASALDQLVWARNSMRGTFYVGPSGKIHAFAAGQLSTSAYLTFSDSKADAGAIYYTDVDCNFGSQALVNQLMVQRHNVDETEDGGQKTYGPYTNSASVASWGVRSATLDVNDGVPSTLAAAALAVYANPSIFASGLRFNARDHFDKLGSLIPFAPVNVKFSKAGLDTKYRVLSIEHDITPERWETAVKFRPMETPSSVSVTNPPAGANTGPTDVTPPQPGILGSRYRNANFDVASGSMVTIPYNVADEMDGIAWDGANNRWVIPRDGRYSIHATARNSQGSGVITVIQINVNGNGVARSHELILAGTDRTDQVSAIKKLAAGDVVSASFLPSGGNGAQIRGDGSRDTRFTIAYLGA